MSHDSQPKGLQEKAETNVGLFLVLTFIVVSIAGLVEITPLFYLDTDEVPAGCSAEAPEKCLNNGPLAAKFIPGVVWDAKNNHLEDWRAGDGVRPLKPLEVAGRDVYIREGCFLCHSQMIRPFRDENERYGHYSLASESMYDHPYQWGSKRTGPDLARVGGKYSDEWHMQHLKAPRSVVPESVMPNYPWLATNKVDGAEIADHMKGLATVGVPYKDEDFASAAEITGKTELQAVIAFLQSLGTMVKFQEGVTYRE